jgi:hypothetical protein
VTASNNAGGRITICAQANQPEKANQPKKASSKIKNRAAKE